MNLHLRETLAGLYQSTTINIVYTSKMIDISQRYVYKSHFWRWWVGREEWLLVYSPSVHKVSWYFYWEWRLKHLVGWAKNSSLDILFLCTPWTPNEIDVSLSQTTTHTTFLRNAFHHKYHCFLSKTNPCFSTTSTINQKESNDHRRNQYLSLKTSNFCR